MKKALLTLFCLAAMMAGCHKDTLLEQDPQVTENQKEIGATKVTFSWVVDYPSMVSSVVEVSKNEDMSQSVCYGSEDLVEQKQFKVTAHGFTEITKYYYRFKVWNSSMNYQTEVSSFRTVAGYPSTVSTAMVVDITLHTAKGGGNVIDDGGADIIERGICWGM